MRKEKGSFRFHSFIPVGVANCGWLGLGVALFLAFLLAPVGVRLVTAATEAPADAGPPEVAELVLPAEAAAAPLPPLPEGEAVDPPAEDAAVDPLDALFLPFFGAGLRFSFFTGAGTSEK